MEQYRLDVKGTQRVDYANDDAGIIKLANGVIAAEALLPAQQRFPGLSVLQKCTTAASEGLLRFETGRSGTSAAAPSVEQAYATAQEVARDIVNGVTYFHRRELPVAEEWGIEVTRSASGDRTKLPKTQDGLIKMLGKAIEKEQSLPEAQRLPHPKLEEIISARDNLVTALARRTEANTLREQGLLVRVAESAAVFRLLQLCAHWHIVMDFDGVVDARLQSMGFTVVEIQPKAAKAAAPIEPEAPTAPAAAA
jgi:hypothetical protein